MDSFCPKHNQKACFILYALMKKIVQEYSRYGKIVVKFKIIGFELLYYMYYLFISSGKGI